MHSKSAVANAKQHNYPSVASSSEQLTVEAPGGYKFHLVEEECSGGKVTLKTTGEMKREKRREKKRKEEREERREKRREEKKRERREEREEREEKRKKEREEKKEKREKR